MIETSTSTTGSIDRQVNIKVDAPTAAKRYSADPWLPTARTPLGTAHAAGIFNDAPVAANMPLFYTIIVSL